MPYRGCGEAGRCRHRPLRRCYKECGTEMYPPVTAAPCQPPLGKGAEGTGDADCHSSDIGHWFAMTGFFTRSRCKAGRADRGVRPYGLAPTKNASHARRHERRKNRGSTLVYHSMGAFYARPGGGRLHPPRSRTHFPRRFTGRLAAGDRPSLGKAVARTLSDQRAM